MRKEVSDVSAGRRRCRGSRCERRGGGKGVLKALLRSRGKPSKAEALSDKRRFVSAGGARQLLGNAGGGGRGRGGTREGILFFFLVVVDKVAADPVGAEADGVKCATRLSFVFRMPVKIPQLLWPVGKLALPTILAQPVLSEGSTQFSLITG